MCEDRSGCQKSLLLCACRSPTEGPVWWTMKHWHMVFKSGLLTRICLLERSHDVDDFKILFIYRYLLCKIIFVLLNIMIKIRKQGRITFALCKRTPWFSSSGIYCYLSLSWEKSHTVCSGSRVCILKLMLDPGVYNTPCSPCVRDREWPFSSFCKQIIKVSHYNSKNNKVVKLHVKKTLIHTR